MTSEQNEQWRAAVLGDGSEPSPGRWPALTTLAALLPEPAEFLEQSLLASNERLAGMGVPNWAILLREVCALRSWKSSEADSHWVPEFLQRSETALIGLALRYPGHDEAEAAFQRLCVRYVREEIQPFVAHAKTLGWRKRSRYKWMIRLHHLCERYFTMGSALRWPKHLGSLPRRVLYLSLGLLYFLWFCITRWGKEYYEYPDPPKRREGFSTYFLSEHLLRGINSVLNPRFSESGDYDSRGHDLCCMRELEIQYRWMHDDHADSGHSYTRHVAVAYVTALEAECSPPDWLPTISPLANF